MIFDTFPQLEDDALLLKKPALSDLPALEGMMQDPLVYRYEPTCLPELNCGGPGALLDGGIDRLFADRSCILMGIYEKSAPDRLVGLAELYDWVPARDKISIGYRLRSDCWHRGIGSRVVAILKDYLLDGLGMTRITAHVEVANPASAHCLLNNGFVQRRAPHEEDWGHAAPVMANKYVIYPPEDGTC